MVDSLGRPFSEHIVPIGTIGHPKLDFGLVKEGRDVGGLTEHILHLYLLYYYWV